MILMVELHEMPYAEKYTEILGYMKLVEEFAPKVVKEELGTERVSELRRMWSQGAEPITDDMSDEARYETAYRNFIHNWVTAKKFVAEHRGDYGAASFMRAAVNAWKQKYALSSLLPRTIGAVSSKAAFRTLAKQLAYKLQAFSPFSVKELDDNHMVLMVAPCKILNVQDGISFCSGACQNIIPSWLDQQFNIKMHPKRQGANCQVTFEPY